MSDFGNFGVGVVEGEFEEGAMVLRVHLFEQAGGLDADMGVGVGETKAEPVGSFVPTVMGQDGDGCCSNAFVFVVGQGFDDVGVDVVAFDHRCQGP